MSYRVRRPEAERVTEGDLSKDNNTSERLFGLVIGWRHIGMAEKSKELINLFSDQLKSESFGRREVQLMGTVSFDPFSTVAEQIFCKFKEL